MIELQKLTTQADSRMSSIETNGSVTLPIEQRVRSRVRVVLDDGRQAGIFLERGSILRGGDFLAGGGGEVIQVVAAEEQVSTVYGGDATLLARAAYHLGNRHVPLQVEPAWLRYQHDHVLDEMVMKIGLEVRVEHAPFEPEAGAYQQADNGHHHHSHNS